MIIYIKEHIKLRRLLIVVLVLMNVNSWASTPNLSTKANTVKNIKLYFRQQSSLLERDYKSNLSALRMLDTILNHSSSDAKNRSVAMAIAENCTRPAIPQC